MSLLQQQFLKYLIMIAPELLIEGVWAGPQVLRVYFTSGAVVEMRPGKMNVG